MTRPAIYPPAITPGPGDASPPEPEPTGCPGCDYGRLVTCPRCETIHCTDCGMADSLGCEPCPWCTSVLHCRATPGRLRSLAGVLEDPRTRPRVVAQQIRELARDLEVG